MTDEISKAIKALEAAVRKCRRANIDIKVVLTWENEDGSTQTRSI